MPNRIKSEIFRDLSILNNKFTTMSNFKFNKTIDFFQYQDPKLIPTSLLTLAPTWWSIDTIG